MKSTTKHSLNLKPEERFLFERLPDVVRLESAMKDIRRKYSQLWEDIGRHVQRQHPALNRWLNHVIDYGQAGIGREFWRSVYKTWPVGFFVRGISLERLCTPDTDPPDAGIWLKPPDELHIDLETLRKRLGQEAKEQLGLPLVSKSNKEISLYFDLPESRDDLLGMLKKKKEAQFADCMVSHFTKLAKLTPLIDEAYERASSNHPQR